MALLRWYGSPGFYDSGLQLICIVGSGAEHVSGAERGAERAKYSRSVERVFIQRPERSLCLAPVPLQYRSHHEPRACTNPPRIHLCLQQLTKLSAYTSKIVRCEGEMEFVKYFQKQTDRSYRTCMTCRFVAVLERYWSGTGARQSDCSSLWIKTRSAHRLYFARSAPLTCSDRLQISPVKHHKINNTFSKTCVFV